MAITTFDQLLEAGVHFGHLKRKWNPAMAPYIFMERNGIHIIDLYKTVAKIDEAAAALKQIAKSGKKILFVATKKQAKEVLAAKATEIGMPYVIERWPGGMLTNFPTIRKAVKKMASIDKMIKDGTFDNLSKREKLQVTRQRAKLEKTLGSIADLTRLPSALFVVDVMKEHIAVREANRLGIPVFAMVDTNSDPTNIDFVIPANDDATKSIEVILNAVCGAVAEGLEERKIEKVDAEAAEAQGEATAKKERKTRIKRTKAEDDEALNANVASKVIKGLNEDEEYSNRSPAENQLPAKSEPVKNLRDLLFVIHRNPLKENIMAVTMADITKLRKMTGAGMMDCKKALEEANNDFDGAIEIIRKRGQAIAAKREDREAAEGCVLATSKGDYAAIVALKCETDFVAQNKDFVALTQKILDAAIENKPADLEALKAIKLDGRTIAELVTDQSGVTGEKMELGYFDSLSAASTIFYIHPGNKLATIVGFNQADVEHQVARDVAMQVAAMNPIAVRPEEVPTDIIEKELEIAREKAREAGKPENLIDRIAQGSLQKYYKEFTLLQQEFVKDPKQTIEQYLKAQNKELTVTAFRRFTLNAE